MKTKVKWQNDTECHHHIFCREFTTVPVNTIFERSILPLVGTSIIPRMMIFMFTVP